jgi:hypothetical protein
MVLGYLGWYSLKTGSVIDYSLMKRNFKKYNIETMNIKQPSEGNLFRKACSSIEIETREGTIKSVKVPDTKLYISRTLVLETDKGKRTLGTLKFNKRTKEISLRKAGRDEYKYKVKVEQYLEDTRGKIDDSHLRQVIRDCFENKLEGIKLRNGLYFIEKSNARKINDLSKALNKVEGCNIFANELEDTPEQREMLKLFIEDQFETEIEEAYSLWKEITDKDINKILAKDVVAVNEAIKRLERTADRAAAFTNKQFRTECLYELNDLKLGFYKYERSLEEI